MEKRLVGPIERIFTGSELGKTEGPHLYRHDGYYYLLTAEGGTGHGHAVTMARSRSIAGPYELDPKGPVLTAVGHPDTQLKKAGHADIVETPDGWYMVHLCSRPIGHGVRGREEGWSVLGRETAIQRVEWDASGWLRLAGGGNKPAISVPAPQLQAAEGGGHAAEEFVESFDGPLSIHWQSLRAPLGEDQLSLTARPGYLRLFGAEPPVSHFRQSLIARRQQAFRYEVQVVMEFEPEDYNQMAGLICYYCSTKFHYLYITRGDGITSGDAGRELGILSLGEGKEVFPLAGSEIALPETGEIRLRASVDGAALCFGWSSDGSEWLDAGPVLDMTLLADETPPTGSFTGAFVGICCQDLSGRMRHADFGSFTYREQ
jgi:xylan 1,4-beta-xylosidase